MVEEAIVVVTLMDLVTLVVVWGMALESPLVGGLERPLKKNGEVLYS